MNPIFYPVLATLLLTAVVWFVMLATRMTAFSRGEPVDPDQMRTRSQVQPMLSGAAAYSSDNFHNLLEVPLLFYVLVGVLSLGGMVDPLYVQLAWVFCIFRYLHSLVHCTYNKVMHRFLMYLVSTFALWVMLVRALLSIV